MWLGAIAHADCALHFAPTGSSGTFVQIGAADHAPAPQDSDSDSDDTDYQQFLEASALPP